MLLFRKSSICRQIIDVDLVILILTLRINFKPLNEIPNTISCIIDSCFVKHASTFPVHLLSQSFLKLYMIQQLEKGYIVSLELLAN
jgi:hypothetical protein